MPGDLIGDSVLVKDQAEASQIYNKGFYGYPQSGGGIELDLLEAIFLQECDRLVVSEEGSVVSHPELIRKAARASPDFGIRYIVYRDLRQRGYVVKSDAGDFDFRVFPRGGTPSTTQTKYWVNAVSERAPFHIRDMIKLSQTSDQTRKELLLAVVDEEGDITYYQAAAGAPHAPKTAKVDEGEVEGFLLEDRVLVMNGTGQSLHSQGFYGKPIGRTLQLSLIETAHLMRLGRLIIRLPNTGRKMGVAAFKKKATSIQSDFELRMRAYDDMREKDLVVKTGFKYGTHFRVYDGDPSNHHSRYLVHAIPADYETGWPEISRAVRLAHGVKKDILFAAVSAKSVEYVRLRRMRP